MEWQKNPMSSQAKALMFLPHDRPTLQIAKLVRLAIRLVSCPLPCVVPRR